MSVSPSSVHRLLLLGAALACSSGACSESAPAGDGASDAVEASVTTEAPVTTAPAPVRPEASSAAGSTLRASDTSESGPVENEPGGEATDSATALCARTGTSVVGEVENGELREASGLIRSRADPDLYWSHNDGGEGVLYAISSEGGDLGSHEIAVEGIDDVEDIALISGRAGWDLLLADIGDNDFDRSSIRIYRFAEPDPGPPGPIGDVEVLEYVYPDRPHNAEVLLVDEAANRVVIVTKEQVADDGTSDDRGSTSASFVFEGPLERTSSEPIELVAIGTIDMVALESMAGKSPPHPAALFGAAGVPTAGDVSADGSTIAVRTYGTVWVWSRHDDQTVAEALLGEPCEVRAAFELLGEAIAFDDGGLTTLGEGIARPLHVIAR